MSKLKNIEFIRFFLIISVVFLHMFIDRAWNLCTLYPNISIYQTIKSAVAHSNNCVEGFFIIAGFFLVYTFRPDDNLKDFIIKKYLRLSPVILFSIVLSAIGALFGAMSFSFIPNLLTVFLLNNFVLKISVGSNPVLWYTSALFAGLLLYFCIIKYFPIKIKYWSILILIVISYSILEILQHGSFANPLKNYYHIFNIGFLRAVGGIGLGCLAGFLYNNYILKYKNEHTKLMNVICSVLEFVSFGFIIWWCIFIHGRINNIIFTICFIFLLLLFLFKKGLLSYAVDRDIWIKLGRYQYSIYVVHYVIIRILGNVIWKNCSQFIANHPILPIIFDLSVIVSVGIFSYHMVELPCTKFLKDKFVRKQN